MNISENLQRILTDKQNIANAINAKGVSCSVSESLDTYADKISLIEGGGGGGTDTSKQTLVIFIDYDGTELLRYFLDTLDNVELTLFPNDPDHTDDGLIFDGWNRETTGDTTEILDYIDQGIYEKQVIVGATYRTSSGYTEIKFFGSQYNSTLGNSGTLSLYGTIVGNYRIKLDDGNWISNSGSGFSQTYTYDHNIHTIYIDWQGGDIAPLYYNFPANIISIRYGLSTLKGFTLTSLLNSFTNICYGQCYFLKEIIYPQNIVFDKTKATTYANFTFFSNSTGGTASTYYSSNGVNKVKTIISPKFWAVNVGEKDTKPANCLLYTGSNYLENVSVGENGVLSWPGSINFQLKHILFNVKSSFSIYTNDTRGLKYFTHKVHNSVLDDQTITTNTIIGSRTCYENCDLTNSGKVTYLLQISKIFNVNKINISGNGYVPTLYYCYFVKTIENNGSFAWSTSTLNWSYNVSLRKLQLLSNHGYNKTNLQYCTSLYEIYIKDINYIPSSLSNDYSLCFIVLDEDVTTYNAIFNSVNTFIVVQDGYFDYYRAQSSWSNVKNRIMKYSTYQMLKQEIGLE